MKNKQTAVRTGVIDILKGNVVLPMYVTNFPPTEAEVPPVES